MPSNETYPHIDYVIEPDKTGETPVTTILKKEKFDAKTRNPKTNVDNSNL